MILLDKTIRRLKNLVIRSLFRVHDLFLGTYSKFSKGNSSIERIIRNKIDFTPTQEDEFAVSLYLQHKFNLLGSGWTNIYHGMKCVGFEGKYFETDISESVQTQSLNKKYRDKLKKHISASYVPIDWHIDFKTGYRWNENTWYRDIRYGQSKMGDVKVPWELSRFQHLPDIAIQYSCTKDLKYVNEFKDQVLDWVSSNPPRWGVNWACTMDVGIRIANILISYDIFKSAGIIFDDFFNDVIINCAYDHALHISTNLEWSETQTGNHYLANVCGLFIVSMYLPSNRKTDAWLAFSIQELMVETQKQFLLDGGHYEFSSSYHRLCAEMISVCLIFAEGIDKKRAEKIISAKAIYMQMGPKLKLKYVKEIRENYIKTNSLFRYDIVELLAKAAHLTFKLTKPNGNIVQIGDNDNGRFFRLGGWIKNEKSEFLRNNIVVQNLEQRQEDFSLINQNHLNHSDWLICAYILTKDNIFISNIQDYENYSIYRLASSFMKISSIQCSDNSNQKMQKKIQVKSIPNKELDENALKSFTLSSVMNFNVNLLDGIELTSFVDFGIFVYRSRKMFLAIRCVDVMNGSLQAHLHSDQLSFELMVDGEEIAVDPGTYVYTASKLIRNTYRSSSVHVGPTVIDMINPEKDLQLDVFQKIPFVYVEFINSSESNFTGKIRGSWGSIERSFIITENTIEITDRYNLKLNYKPASQDLFKPAKRVNFSSGYGEILAYE